MKLRVPLCPLWFNRPLAKSALSAASSFGTAHRTLQMFDDSLPLL
jgi:hypothetical protein